MAADAASVDYNAYYNIAEGAVWGPEGRLEKYKAEYMVNTVLAD